jgi:hypothetical protein
VDDTPVQEVERVRPAPPPGGIRGIPVMGKPKISFIILDPVKVRDIFGPAGCLKDTEVFT